MTIDDFIYDCIERQKELNSIFEFITQIIDDDYFLNDVPLLDIFKLREPYLYIKYYKFYELLIDLSNEYKETTYSLNDYSFFDKNRKLSESKREYIIYKIINMKYSLSSLSFDCDLILREFKYICNLVGTYFVYSKYNHLFEKVRDWDFKTLYKNIKEYMNNRTSQRNLYFEFFEIREGYDNYISVSKYIDLIKKYNFE